MPLLVLQAGLAAVMTLLMLFINTKAGLSALVAGIICLGANAVFAHFVFRQKIAQAAKEILRNICVGEVLKLALIVFFMMIALQLFKVSIAPFLLTYFVLQIGLFCAPVVCSNRRASS
jgi:ATP synthase protein I